MIDKIRSIYNYSEFLFVNGWVRNDGCDLDYGNLDRNRSWDLYDWMNGLRMGGFQVDKLILDG